MFRIRDTGKLITLDELKALHPNTSFPLQISAETLDAFKIDIVLESPTPQVTELQTYYLDGAVKQNGAWYTNYVVKPMFDNQADEAAYLENKRVTKIKADIAEFEATITPRRVREAILGMDNGWLTDMDSMIQALRAQL